MSSSDESGAYFLLVLILLSRFERAICLLRTILPREVSDVTILDLDQDVLMDHDVVSEGVVDDLSPDLSFYARDGFLTVIQRNSVTASGFAEAEALKEFISKLSPSFRELVNEFPFLFAPPDKDPPNRAVKHYIHVSPDCVPAARRAYPLSHMKLEGYEISNA